MSCMHVLTFTHKSVSRKITPNPGERDLEKGRKMGEGREGEAKGYSRDNALKVTILQCRGQTKFIAFFRRGLPEQFFLRIGAEGEH